MRTWAKDIHVLADPKKPCGKIRFLHIKDGTEHTYAWATNEMGKSILGWWDNDAPYIEKTHVHIKRIVKNLYKKATVLEHIGDFQPITT